MKNLVLLSSLSGRVLKIAHGGALDPLRANSLEGVCDSIAKGVDGIEVDVQVTRDGQLVLFHDSSLYVDQRQTTISDLTLSELAAITSATKRRHMPQLKEVLEQLRNTQTLLLLDIKSSEAKDLDNVMKLINDANAGDKTLIASFYYVPLARAKELHPTIPTLVTVGFSRAMTKPLGFLWTLLALLSPVYAATRVRANAILCPSFRVTRRLVSKAHKAKIAVFVWTSDHQRTTRRAADHDIDGLVY